MASLVEGANRGTQFSVNCYFSGQISVNYTIVLTNSQLTTNFGLLITFTFMQRILFRHNPNFSSLLKSRYKFTWTLPLVQFISNWKYKSHNHQCDTGVIDPDTPVMISWLIFPTWPCMSCHKLLQSHLLRHFHYLIGISLVLIMVAAVCPVSFCWPKFQSIFNPCNPLQQMTRNIINAKM